MQNTVRITKTEIIKNRINVCFEVSGEWSELFNGNDFYAEYGPDMSTLPPSLAVVPLMGTLLPLSWLFDGEIIVEELDKDYFACIPEVKNGFSQIFPHMDFGGCVTAGKLVENKVENTKYAQLFSGGLDAFHTLLSNIEKKPLLVSVWGADIAPDNAKAWSVVEKHIKETTEQFSLDATVIRSNLRELNTNKLYIREELKKSGDGWWHGFHHGIGMLSLVAPLAYVYGLTTLFIASSFTEKDRVPCSSDPKTDNFVRFCGCSVFHYGYESNRQDKTQLICEYAKEHHQDIPVRVCWESTDGKNCCMCEKCYRTMLEFFAEGEDPRRFGFDYGDVPFAQQIEGLNRVETKVKYLSESQVALRRNYKRNEVPRTIRWIYDKDFSKAGTWYQHKKMKLSRRIYLKSPKFIRKMLATVVKLKNKQRG